MAVMWRWAAACMMVVPVTGHAQSAPDAAVAAGPTVHLEIPAGTRVQFATVDELSSKRQAKGDHIALKTVGDTVVNGHVVIPANSAAVGEIADAHGTGGLGVSGKLSISPLYMIVAGATVRFSGLHDAHPQPGADTVIGVVLLLPVSGKTAVIPPGTQVAGAVLHTVSVPVVTR